MSTDEGEQTSVVVLRDPTFDASSGTLTFTTEPVADDEGAGASFGHGGAPVDALPASFGPATVFVDTGDPAGQTADGKIAVFGVTEDDYDVLKESAEKAGRNACVTTEGLEICQLLEWTGSEVSWTVAAALLEGDDDAESAFELKVIYPGSVYAEAISPVENTDSKWVTVDWESPSVEVPGAGLELEAVVQIGDSAAVVVSCVVPHPGIPLSYYCIPGTE